MSSSPAPPVLSRNAATCLPFQLQNVYVPPPPTIREAYDLALGAEKARAAQSTLGYRLYWVAAGSFGSRDVRASSSDYLVVGRHTACDVVLDGDPSVALRHLLVRVTCLDDGCPRLSVLDLHTNDGFEVTAARSSEARVRSEMLTFNGSLQRSLVAVGPIAMRVGSHVLIALPSGEAPPHELPEPIHVHPYRAPARALGQSMLSLMPPPISISERGASGATGDGPRAFAVTLQGQRGWASANLTRLDVERGVLFGRAPKCVDAGLRNILTSGISRVHLLVLAGATPDECVAYDLASTQGVWEHGRQVRRVVLSNGGAQLRLGTTGFVQLTWRGV